jgi:hypothetical protein
LKFGQIDAGAVKKKVDSIMAKIKEIANVDELKKDKSRSDYFQC